jgi:toxin-antitoxin system PIN domain toxin
LLLDVNSLLALGWSTHQFHHKVVARLERRPQQPWGTCALTQLGFVRLSCNEAAVGVQKTASEAVSLLEALTADRAHVFLASLPSPATFARVFDRVLGHQQVTDAYLVGLARHHKASLLTFDQRAEAHGPDAIEVLR